MMMRMIVYIIHIHHDVTQRGIRSIVLASSGWLHRL